MKGLLTSHGISHVYHYAPLHYLPFIARTRQLLSKSQLKLAGYSNSHFRSTSHKQDAERGFSDYVHLMSRESPPILQAKISKGFPHLEIKISSPLLEKGDFHLCRYNIAKCRYLKRPGATAPAENSRNGYYHGNKQLPTAETAIEIQALLNSVSRRDVIEVLVPGSLALDKDTTLIFFDDEEKTVGDRILRKANLRWKTETKVLPWYTAKPEYSESVFAFIAQASVDPNWLGSGLEFDRV
jgi:hypothetical protein